MTSPKKRGEGTSCHHCKKRIRPNEMLKCTRGEIVPTNSRKRKRPCVKKYCLHCIKTFYNNQYLDDNNSGSFICPACRDECRCAACRRRVMKARLKNDGSALENEADGQANSILESQTPDATNIEEGQVNGLLEILDSRPDVQDIIRRGMAMDFADDNAKILYVGHLIDQALTRPDVLALYYASSHGRANNCRIKTESHSHSQSHSMSVSNDLPPETVIEREVGDGDVVMAGNGTVSAKRKHRNKHRSKHRKAAVKYKDGAKVKREPLLNGISAPQPATMSLSGGNGMQFGSFPPAVGRHVGGVTVPNLPPIHIPFPMERNGGVKIPALPLNIAMANGVSVENGVPPPPSYGHGADGESVGAQFVMNVTPSAMMGGPPLASM